jgi:hypothetical protein
MSGPTKVGKMPVLIHKRMRLGWIFRFVPGADIIGI